MSAGVVPYAYAADGQYYALGDGPELFTYSGGEDNALWKQFCNGMLVGLGISPGSVHSLEDTGGYGVWHARTGDSILAVELGVACSALAVAPNGTAAVVTERGAALVGADGSVRPISVANASAVAFSGDGSRLVVGTSSGEIVLVDPNGGGVLAGTALGAPVADISWCGREWVVAAGNRLWFVAADVQLAPPAPNQPAPSAVTRVVDVAGTPRSVTANSDGVLVACDDGQNNVLLYETHQYRLAGTVKFNRTLGDLQFGPATSLGIGLEYADANRLDVLAGTLTRSKAGLGKGNTPWYPRIELDQFILRGSVATKRAGGAPIANVQEVEQTGSSKTLLYVGIALFFGFMCCGGITSALAVWRFAL